MFSVEALSATAPRSLPMPAMTEPMLEPPARRAVWVLDNDAAICARTCRRAGVVA